MAWSTPRHTRTDTQNESESLQRHRQRGDDGYITEHRRAGKTSQLRCFRSRLSLTTTDARERNKHTPMLLCSSTPRRAPSHAQTYIRLCTGEGFLL